MLRRALRFVGWTLATWIVLSVGAVLALRWIDPPSSAFMIRERLAGPVRYRWVDDANISAHIKVAVIAAEDQNFPAHYGFDLKSINDALEDRQRGRRVRGASTISQQVAKNMFLWPEQSWLRKGLEAMNLQIASQPGHQLWQLNAVTVPAGVDEAAVRKRLLEEFGIEVGAGLGPLKGKIWRVGLMGENSRPQVVETFLGAMRKVLGAS